MPPKFSVIVPIYNAETTLRRCIDSLLCQQYADCEVLLINDGSIDKSGEICRAYADSSPQIRYFEKENGGVSSARNLGLEHASGEYILFVDSDDYVSEDYFQVLSETVNKTLADLILFSTCLWHGETPEYRMEEDGFFSSDDAVTAKICTGIRSQAIANLPAKALKRQLVEKAPLRFFAPLYIAEDALFAITFASKVHSIAAISNVLYHVCLENQNSLSRKRRDDLCDQLLLEHRELFEVVGNALPQRKEKLYDAVCFSFYRSAYSSSKELLKYGLSGRERRGKIREICTRYLQEGIRPRDRKTRLISVPIRWHLSWVIDEMIKAAAKIR